MPSFRKSRQLFITWRFNRKFLVFVIFFDFRFRYSVGGECFLYFFPWKHLSIKILIGDKKSPAIYYKSIKVESPAEPRRVVVQVEDQGILSRLFAQIKSYFNQKWACDNYFEKKRGVVRNFVIEGMACQPPSSLRRLQATPPLQTSLTMSPSSVLQDKRPKCLHLCT